MLDDGTSSKIPEFGNKRKQRRANRLNKRNGDVVSIEHGTGDIDIDTTPVNELFPGQRVGAAAVKERSARQLDESIRKSLDDYKEYDDRYNSVIGDLESAGKLGKYDAVQAKKGELPYQTWERATGLKWSEAKKRGYTTGRDQENLQLQRDLLAGNVSKQGGYSDERPEGYKNSKLGKGSYYLTKPKQAASAQAKPTASVSASKQVSSNNDYIPGKKFNPYKTLSFRDGLGKNTKSILYGGGSGTGGGSAKLSTQNTSKQTSTISKPVKQENKPIVNKNNYPFADTKVQYDPYNSATWGAKPDFLKSDWERSIESNISETNKNMTSNNSYIRQGPPLSKNGQPLSGDNLPSGIADDYTREAVNQAYNGNPDMLRAEYKSIGSAIVSGAITGWIAGPTSAMKAVRTAKDFVKTKPNATVSEIINSTSIRNEDDAVRLIKEVRGKSHLDDKTINDIHKAFLEGKIKGIPATPSTEVKGTVTRTVGSNSSNGTRTTVSANSRSRLPQSMPQNMRNSATFRRISDAQYSKKFGR